MNYLGIMTGNSLDAVDVVMTSFEGEKMTDVFGYSKPIPKEIAEGFRKLKVDLQLKNGNIAEVYAANPAEFDGLHEAYIQLVASAVKQALSEAQVDKKDIEAIGFHGQTCAHYPPSIVKERAHTLQVGSGQMLANLTGIKVVYDFRSDDLMNGGEAAPLAPVHNLHIARDLKRKGIFPTVFCNGGNTGNIAVISVDEEGEEKVMGWDTGPFNHLADYLVRREKNEACDFDGKYGSGGKVNYDLLRLLFAKAVITENEDNFLLKYPPKSSDPAWYRILSELTDHKMSFEDRLRTAEFFSAYCMVYNLQYMPENWQKPQYFLTFGGGWRNPIIKKDFEDLLAGKASVLPEHQDVFAALQNPDIKVVASDVYGYNGQFMEARIFADMARCLLIKEPFSYPETTGCKTATVGGIIAFPEGKDTRKWSRAAYGWQNEFLS